MGCNKCCECEELFWCDDPEQELCPECKEAPSKRANQERATEQWLAYIQRLRKESK